MKIIKPLLFIMIAMLCIACECRAEQPLLQKDKKTVFQRVVSNPGATLYSDPGATTEKSKPRTFTAYYVYERNNDMVKVGASSTKSDGWMKAGEVTEWPQAITMEFTNQSGRMPVLFFRDQDSLVQLCNSDGISKTVDEYVSLFENPNAPKPDDLPVVATEPLAKEGQVSSRNFYLMPVLKYDPQFNEGGTQLLEVACVDPGISEPATKNAGKDSGNTGKMRTGIVFLIDTTKSMGPYIDQTKKVINTVFDKLEKSPAKDNVSIAVVAFRSDVEKRPDTEYNTRVISDFVTVDERAKLENDLNNLKESKALTHAYDEDSLSGVKAAVDKLNWENINSRAMMLISDAGPLAGDDPSSATGMSPEAMASYLRQKNIYLTAAHILAPGKEAKKDRAYAEKSYRDLSLMSNNRSSYIPINAPDPQTGAAAFEKVAQTMADAYCAMAEKQMRGELARAPKAKDPAANASPEEQAKQLADTIGYAMQLQFVGDKNKTRAPNVKNLWIADADLSLLEENPNAAPYPAVQPAVLLTKSQLSQLRDQVGKIVEIAEKAFLQDNENFNFYQQLISAAAQMTRDPTSFSDNPDANLAQKGVLLEVLDGLPYESAVLRLKQEDWTNMNTGDQKAFITRLKQLLNVYAGYDSDNRLWEGFGSENQNEWVYRVPLKDLP